MPTIDSITNTNNAATFATQKNDAMSKDAFLELMIAQLQNQDPLEPMDGTDYSAQLAQFSSLEQLQNINNSINQSIDANYLLTQSISNTMTAALIGKDVKIASDSIDFTGQSDTGIGYELPADAKNVEVKIFDDAGTLVKTFTDLKNDKGEYKLSWDFTDNDDKNVSHGKFRVEVTAETLDGEDMVAAQYLIGNIDGVRFTSSGTAILVDGVEFAVQIYSNFEADNSLTDGSNDDDNEEG